MQENKSYQKALTIAGSDSGGGAGIQADLKSFSANGVYGMSVLTAITAQNTLGVQGIHPIPDGMIGQQIRSIFDDMGADVVKTGMLHSSGVIKTISETLRDYPRPPLVVDPVMVATSGDKLLQDDAVQTMIEVMLPMATLITPNRPEAELILERKLNTFDQARQAAKDLAQTGAGAILLKGGHSNEKEVLDLLYIPQKDELVEMTFQRVETPNTHGTGCTLASAIAAWLARGFPIKEATRKGLDYTHQAIKNGASYKLGKGHGPVHHFYQTWT
ncbi:MAG TPA: bifunctional hydroxymethylpyrimidine kinase/phosphomethylpyrimidine kinase [Bacteroidales bacterium]|nr:bifunctional hydroxymethylpyrimidine kinase/phosphomethylpyrimidine kinase [Bacteroidales bacterium]